MISRPSLIKYKDLIEKYPELLGNIEGPPVEQGWNNILDQICSTIECQIKINGVTRPKVLRIKEKYGTLCFYYRWIKIPPVLLRREIEDTISMIEYTSNHICERCGRPGELRDGAWIKTLCDFCETNEILQGKRCL